MTYNITSNITHPKLFIVSMTLNALATLHCRTTPLLACRVCVKGGKGRLALRTVSLDIASNNYYK